MPQETIGFDWVFVELNSEIFPLRFLSSLLKSILIVMKLCFLIDDNMHWALIDLFCDTLFVYKTIEFSSVALNWLATSAFKNWYAILCLRKRLALTESFFWRPKSLDFLYFAVSVPCFNRLRLWWNCAFELIIKSIGLWLTCFVTKFVCITWVFSCCFRVAGFDCFQKELCAILCLKEDERWPLTESDFL